MESQCWSRKNICFIKSRRKLGVNPTSTIGWNKKKLFLKIFTLLFHKYNIYHWYCVYMCYSICFFLKLSHSQTSRYMEEIVENTLSLLSVKHDQSHLVTQKILDPIYFFALVDTKAVWFKKWMVRKKWNVFILFSALLYCYKE